MSHSQNFSKSTRQLDLEKFLLARSLPASRHNTFEPEPQINALCDITSMDEQIWYKKARDNNNGKGSTQGPPTAPTQNLVS